ncbi:MAG: hypothetical protein AB1758_23665, partial [Candidatus Eremiobacterota bacterium]
MEIKQDLRLQTAVDIARKTLRGEVPGSSGDPVETYVPSHRELKEAAGRIQELTREGGSESLKLVGELVGGALERAREEGDREAGAGQLLGAMAVIARFEDGPTLAPGAAALKDLLASGKLSETGRLGVIDSGLAALASVARLTGSQVALELTQSTALPGLKIFEALTTLGRNQDLPAASFQGFAGSALKDLQTRLSAGEVFYHDLSPAGGSARKLKDLAEADVRASLAQGRPVGPSAAYRTALDHGFGPPGAGKLTDYSRLYGVLLAAAHLPSLDAGGVQEATRMVTLALAQDPLVSKLDPAQVASGAVAFLSRLEAGSVGGLEAKADELDRALPEDGRKAARELVAGLTSGSPDSLSVDRLRLQVTRLRLSLAGDPVACAILDPALQQASGCDDRRDVQGILAGALTVLGQSDQADPVASAARALQELAGKHLGVESQRAGRRALAALAGEVGTALQKRLAGADHRNEAALQLLADG